MYKTSSNALVNGCVTHQKQQISAKVDITRRPCSESSHVTALYTGWLKK